MAVILVLDDVLDAAVLIKRILTKKGHTVHIFTDEDEALRFVKATPVELAIIDMKLRKMEGTEVLAEIRRLRPGIRAIMMTGYPTVESAHRARQLGVAAYCVKPLDKRELEEKVALALAGQDG